MDAMVPIERLLARPIFPRAISDPKCDNEANKPRCTMVSVDRAHSEVIPMGRWKAWMEAMNAIVRSLFVLLILLTLSACSTTVPFDKVCGTYRVSYPFGTEILKLE